VGVVEVVVDANHDVQHIADLDRRGHDHALGATVEVALEGLGREELAGAFEHQIHAKVTPRNLAGSPVRRERQRPVRDADAAVPGGRNIDFPAALHAVERQQMRGGCGTALEFIQVDDLEPVVGARVVGGAIRCAEGRPKGQAADAAHAVDANSHGVACSSPRREWYLSEISKIVES